MEDLKKEYDTTKMFNLLFKLVTLEAAVEMVSPAEYAELMYYIISIKELLDN